MILRPGRVEREEDRARQMAVPLRRRQAPGRQGARRLRRARGNRVPLVHRGSPEREEAERQRLQHVDDGPEIQGRAQAGRRGEMERGGQGSAQSADQVPQGSDRVQQEPEAEAPPPSTKEKTRRKRAKRPRRKRELVGA
jgi:hypothetical protein